MRLSTLTGQRTLEREVRINSIQGADIAKFFLNVFIIILLILALNRTLLRPLGSFGLKTLSIRSPIIFKGSLLVAPKPPEVRCPHPTHRPLLTSISEFQINKVVLPTLFF